MADDISLAELGLAARNHGLPQEALQWDITPVGLHYLLIHYDIPDVDPASWELRIGGAVRRPLTLTLADLAARPRAAHTVTMECAGNGRALLDPRPTSQPWIQHAVGTARWSGVSLAELLDEAGPEPAGVEVLFTGLDRGIEKNVEQAYQRSLPLEEARRSDVLVAFEMNDQPLLPQHGAPARLVVPGWYGMAHVKWLSGIEVIASPFDGYQQRRAYRFRVTDEEEGRPVTRILPRSLVVPPGVPEFLSRRRLVEPGVVYLTGRAWSGFGMIASVEVSTDGGESWSAAEVHPAPGPYAWHRWEYTWDATPGTHVLSSRATDVTGRTQPDQPTWNVGGYEVNAIERLVVETR